jgi:hypothetical protein
LSASLKRIEGKIIRIEPDVVDTNDSTIMRYYKAIIETSPTEEYSLTVSRENLLACIDVTDDGSNLTESRISQLIKDQNLILCLVCCVFESDSGVIKEMKRQNSVFHCGKTKINFSLCISMIFY